MKRRQYNTLCDQRKDQIIGYWLFPVILIICLISLPFLDLFLDESMLPWPVWIINGLFLLVSLIFRPQIAVGYIVSLAFTLICSLLFAMSCVGGCILMTTNNSPLTQILSGVVIIGFPFLILGGWLAVGLGGSLKLYRRACD